MYAALLRIHAAQRTCVYLALQDLLARRIQVVCGTDVAEATTAIAMYFVTAGQMGQLRAVEGFLGPAQLEVMPVHVADILQQTRNSLTAA